ncbi:unnamed protein product, partial [Ranitomeya imitator]
MTSEPKPLPDTEKLSGGPVFSETSLKSFVRPCAHDLELAAVLMQRMSAASKALPSIQRKRIFFSYIVLMLGYVQSESFSVFTVETEQKLLKSFSKTWNFCLRLYSHGRPGALSLHFAMSVQAFRLVCASDKEHLPPGIQIECLECCGHDLYIGTNDGCIHHLLLVEENNTAVTALSPPSDHLNTSFTTTRQRQRQLGLKKPICELRAASALGRLLVLCDNTISLLCSDSLEPVAGTKIRGVLSFTLNENPVSGDPFSVEVCVISSKRRTVQIFSVTQERVHLVREVSTPEQPCALAADGHFLCLALSSRYVTLNYGTGHCQDLFPFPSEQKRPIIKRISREEFLLAGPGGLGMFATVAGISQRAPVHWSDNVIGAAVSFPYVLALDEEFITVHSMLDQQQKQSLPFKEGIILQDFEGRVIVATSNGVYILIPLPLEKQIQDLLSNQRVEEALVLAKGARHNIPKEKFQVMYRRILQQAGFIQFAQLQFLEAKELFRSSHLDIRELISLYPLLLPSSSAFIRAHPPLHEYADLNQLTRGDQEKVATCKRFLMSYLSEIRSTEVANGYQEDVDTALLKLYAEVDHESLLDLLVSDNSCEVSDSAVWLEKHKNKKKNKRFILTFRCLSPAQCFSVLAVSTAAGKQSGDVTTLLSGRCAHSECRKAQRRRTDSGRMVTRVNIGLLSADLRLVTRCLPWLPAKTSLNRCHTRRFSDVSRRASDQIKFWPSSPDQRHHSRILIAAVCHTERYR